MAFSTSTWVSMLISLLLLPGIAAAALARSFRTEERKLALLREQDDADSYLPWVLPDLCEWIRANPNDPYSPITCRRYSECVRSLRATDEPRYDWSDEQIARLKLVDG